MGEGRAETALPEGWEFGAFDEFLGVRDGVEEGDEDTVSTGVESAWVLLEICG